MRFADSETTSLLQVKPVDAAAWSESGIQANVQREHWRIVHAGD